MDELERIGYRFGDNFLSSHNLNLIKVLLQNSPIVLSEGLLK